MVVVLTVAARLQQTIPAVCFSGFEGLEEIDLLNQLSSSWV
jgi:hypothetical protein